MIERNDLNDCFELKGFVTNPMQYLKAMHCFVLPSAREDFSLALLEASSAGLPCLAFQVGGNAEIIEDGFSGFVIEPYNIEALTAKLIFLLKNPQEAFAMGQNAKKRVFERFSGEVRIGKLKNLIESLKY